MGHLLAEEITRTIFDFKNSHVLSVLLAFLLGVAPVFSD
jgi:hypothetical protein